MSPLLLAVLLIAHAGCASPPPAPPAAVRAPLGTIGVVGGELVTRCSIPEPPGGESPGKGTRAAAGAGVGAGIGALYGLEVGLPYPPIWFVTVPFGVIVGGITGGVLGLSADPGRPAKPLQPALCELPLEDALAQEVVRTAQSRGAHRVVLLPEWPPAQAEVSAGTSAAPVATVDAVLEVKVVQAGLRGSSAHAWVLTAALTTRARLVRVQDGAELYAREWEERGGFAPLSNWAEDDWQSLRAAFARMAPALAARIVDELFPTDPAGRPVE